MKRYRKLLISLLLLGVIIIAVGMSFNPLNGETVEIKDDSFEKAVRTIYR